MALLEVRAGPLAQLSPTALAAILTGVGVVILGLLIGFVVLLVRAVRRHKRLLADLEERGVVMAQSQKDANRDSVTKPRGVLRRNTILPFNAKSGWGTLPSVETINPPEPPSFPPHYAPPKPAGFVSKPKRISWPFSSRRSSGRGIRMRKMRVSTLSTVIESPKPSPIVPVFSAYLRNEPCSPTKGGSRPTSDQSLLQHHPAFRNIELGKETGLQSDPLRVEPLRAEPLRRSLTAMPVTKAEVHTHPNRSKSAADLSANSKPGPGVMSRFPRPKGHRRSGSTCSQSSGNAPPVELPPLPLEVARLKNDTRRHSLLSRSPSHVSISSSESAGSSILATQSSPAIKSNPRMQKVTKREWTNSMVVGPRPFRDTLTLHGVNQRSQGSIKSNTARFSSVVPSTEGEAQVDSRHSVLTSSSSTQSIGKVKTAESVTMSKIISPACSPLTVRSLRTPNPKRKSGSHVTPYGSPEDRRRRSSMLQNVSANHSAPKRQLSQASTGASSTRSSNGNPFQWDPAPMSAGKPSALKGSPSARKGHKRQNCVRISLTPIVLGPPSRSSSPPFMKDIEEESPTTAHGKTNAALGFSDTRSLPRPPSAPVFAPDLKITATSIRASLTPSSPTLSMANYDHGPIGSPVVSQPIQAHSDTSGYGTHRLSLGSPFNIPKFPSPCHDTQTRQNMASPPPLFALPQPSHENQYDFCLQDTAAGASSPFEVLLEIETSPSMHLLTDEYDPDYPHLIYQTPTTVPNRNFSSPFSTIAEESSAKSTRVALYEQFHNEDSPPCSPKTIPSPTFSAQHSAHKFGAGDTVDIGPLDTIDPAVLSKEALHSLQSPFDNRHSSIVNTPHSNQNSPPIPTSPGSAQSMFQPLLEAAFPPAGQNATNLPPNQRIDSLQLPGLSGNYSPSSLYSCPSGTSTPMPPCSPRPGHADLPTPALNFSAMPTLSPFPNGPRGSPPRPLHSSIQKLRRMNSDAERGGRGERRYLRLGREDSIALSSEESWLDELDHEPLCAISDSSADEDEAWDEEKGRRLVGDLLEDWEEEASMFDSQDTTVGAPSTPPKESKGPLVASGMNVRDTEGGHRADRSSSIWEDGERFWTSTPSQPPNSPNKPKQRFVPLSSSPVSSAPGNVRKRQFEVAKDAMPAQEDSSSITNSHSTSERSKDAKRAAGTAAAAANLNRKRSVLGVGTPNVRIHVHPPSSGTPAGTPGSLYDADGFLNA